MPAALSKQAVESCKFCRKTFGVDPNPTMKNPGPSDLLARRAPGSKECKACFGFLRNGESRFSQLTRSALEVALRDPAEQSAYESEFKHWCQGRQDGKRRRGDETETAVVEDSSSFSTKEVLGYMWPVSLLKKHDRAVPKKLQSINHQGKAVKGVICDEWVLGAIEVSSTSAKSAKHITQCGVGGEDDDHDASRAFDISQKKVRVSAEKSADGEITLKGPKAGGDEEEWYSMMWGDQKFSASSKGSEDDGGESACKKRKGAARNRQTKPAVPAFDGTTAAADSQDGSTAVGEASSSTGSAAGGGWSIPLPRATSAVKSKKALQEHKELDKCEALVLQARQIKTQMEDSRNVMQVTLKKVNDVLDKLSNRLTDDATKFFIEIVRQEGAGCRAESVWQQLGESKTLVAGIAQFVEAVQDAEASPETIRDRAQNIKSLGVKLPKNINSVICRRAAEELMLKGEMDLLFQFLDPNAKDEHVDGICSILPDNDSLMDAAHMDKVTKDFQVFCLTELINKILLTQVEPTTESADTDKKMAECVQTLSKLLKAFQTSRIYDSVAPEKSALRDDIARLLVLCSGALPTQTMPSPSETDALEAAKQALTKPKGSFTACLTMYPAGVYMCSRASNLISQFRKDQILQAEIEGAAEFAKSFSIKSYLDISKTKDGDLELSLPTPGKFMDMVAKFRSFEDSGSTALKQSMQACGDAVQERLQEFHLALVQFVQTKLEAKFPQFGSGLRSLVSGTMTDEGAGLCLQTLQGIASYQPANKQIVAKVLGKEAADFEETVSSASKLAGLLIPALSQLRLLRGESVNEAVLMNADIVSLFAAFHDTKLMGNVEKTVKSWLFPVMEVKSFIESAVGAWLVKTTSTFLPFIKMLMHEEMGDASVKSMLRTEIVGTIDCDAEDKDGKGEIDFTNIFAAYVKFSQELKVKIELPPKESEVGDQQKVEVEVHMGFLCLAGSLLQVAKYVTLFDQKLQPVEGQKPFNEIVFEEYGQVRAKEKPSVVYSLDGIVPQLSPFFGMVSKAVTSFTQIKGKMAEGGSMEQEQAFFNHVMGVFGASLACGLERCNSELSSASLLLNSMFTKVQAAHSLPGLFQTAKLERSVIAALVSDTNVQQMIFVGTKCSKVCNQVKEFSEKLRSLPKPEALTTSLSSMVEAVNADLADFSSNQRPKSMPEDGKFRLANFSWFQGSMTLAQVLTRELSPGETRLGLASRCLQLLKNQGMGCEQCLMKSAQQLQVGK